MDEQVSPYQGIESFGNMLRNSVAGSYSVTIFSFLRTIHTVLHSG